MPTHFLALHLALIASLLVATWALARRSRRRARGLVLVTVGLGCPLQGLAQAFPGDLANGIGWSELLFVADLHLHLACVLGMSAIYAQAPAARVRTGALVALLLAAALCAAPSPFPPPLRLGPAWIDARAPAYPVVRQTAPSTCAAAAAATLLRALGHDPAASEATLAARCVSDPTQGTRDLGLYRGLRMSAASPVRFARADVPALAARQDPCIVFVSLERARVPDPALFRELRDRCNWREGERHAVVCFGVEGDPQDPSAVALIGDPRMGFERWSLRHFRALWGGRLVSVGRLRVPKGRNRFTRDEIMTRETK